MVNASLPQGTIQIAPFAQGLPRPVTILCPPDKSITHRSFIFASMAKGESLIKNPLLGADCRSTMEVFTALGVRFTRLVGEVAAYVVHSPGWDRWQSPLVPLNFGNSGTTARLLTGVFAATPGLFITAYGDESLSERPMGRVVKPLRSVGAQIVGRNDASKLPLAVLGQSLKPHHHEVDKASAQVKSALILAGLNIAGETSVTLPLGGRDHSEKILENMGASIRVKRTKTQETITIQGPFRPNPGVFTVPGDPSSAAFFAVLGVLRERSAKIVIRDVLVNPTRTGFVDVLRKMGAALETTPPRLQQGLLEPVCDLLVEGGFPLHAIETTPEMAPAMIDEIPILAVAASWAQGRSRFRGLGELRVKESDRLQKTVELLQTAGKRAWTEGDDLFVEGAATPAQAFVYDPAKDHRLAMAAAIIAKKAALPCVIHDPDCVAVSFPSFFSILESIEV